MADIACGVVPKSGLMARVERLISGKYRIRWTDPWGKRTSKTFATAADANAHYRKVLGDMARGEYIRPSKVTLEAWADQWLAVALHPVRDRLRRDLQPACQFALRQLV